MKIILYTINCCGMIAVKREVAAVPQGIAGFPWSECQEGRFPVKEPDGKSLYKHRSVEQDRDTCVKNARYKPLLRAFV